MPISIDLESAYRHFHNNQQDYLRMKKDLIYWIYLRQHLFETVQHLTETRRQLAEHNLNLIVANKMAHD